VLRPYVADLHIHTVLSPCADYRMVPEIIVSRAEAQGLSILAITDHSSGENAGAVMQAARGTTVTVLPGMEVETREGVHLLTIFDAEAQLLAWQEKVYASLPQRENAESIFGAQLVVDAEGNLIRRNSRLLIAAVEMSLGETIIAARSLGGFCVAAHVDRPANGLLATLGLLPQAWDAAMELSPRVQDAETVQRYPGLVGRRLIRSSDAHRPDEIGMATTAFLLDSPRVAELEMACRHEGGRQILSHRTIGAGKGFGSENGRET